MPENFQPSRGVAEKSKKHPRKKRPEDGLIAQAEEPIEKSKPRLRYRALAAEASVLDRAVEVIGARSEAMRWMGTPVRALDYATPVSLLATAEGRATVLTVLGRLEHGVM